MHALNDCSKHNIQPTGFSTMGFFFSATRVSVQFALSVSKSIKNVRTDTTDLTYTCSKNRLLTTFLRVGHN